MKKYKYSSEILVGVVAGFLGVMIGAGLLFWARLPDRTVDQGFTVHTCRRIRHATALYPLKQKQNLLMHF